MSRKDYRQGMADAMEPTKNLVRSRRTLSAMWASKRNKPPRRQGKLSEAISDITSYITDQEKSRTI